MQNFIENDDATTNEKQYIVLAHAAILYYKDGLTQNEIGKRLGVSRTTVVNYLRMAREQNIVDIKISGASFARSNLSKKLRIKFDLEDVYVASYGSQSVDKSPNSIIETNRHVARIGASALYDIVQPGDVVGVAWGETIHFLSEEMAKRKIKNLSICQMIGSMKTPLLSAAETCAIKIAANFSADCNTLHAPAILSTPQLAKALIEEPIIQSQLAIFSTFTRTIFSVGNCDLNAHIVQSSIASEEEFIWYKSQGAVGVVCGRFIDAEGNHISGDMDERMIGISLQELRKLKNGILVAGGKNKRDAILATIKGGYVSHLVIDENSAQWLLEQN